MNPKYFKTIYEITGLYGNLNYKILDMAKVCVPTFKNDIFWEEEVILYPKCFLLSLVLLVNF